MSRQRRIDRRTRRADSPLVTAVQCGEVDEFPSESADAASERDSASSRMADHLRDPETTPSGDEAFGSEAVVGSSGRQMNQCDVPGLPPGLDVFLSEDNAPASSLQYSDRNEARDIDDIAAAAAIVGSRVQGRKSTSMTLVVLSASFFVGVVLGSEVLERMNRTLLTSTGPGETNVRFDAVPVAPVLAPLTARPTVTRTARYARVVRSRVASIEPVPAPPAPAAPSMAVRAPATGRDTRQAGPVPLAASPLVPEGASAVPATAPSRTALAPPPLAPPPAASPPPAPPPAATAPPAAPAVARPISAAALVAPPPPPVPTEADRIGDVLARYRGAFNALDPAAARGVWPTVDERALGRAFAGLAEQQVNFEHCAIQIAGVRAAARCTGNARYVPKVGSRTPQTTARQWRFDLQKVDDRWVIEAVEAR